MYTSLLQAEASAAERLQSGPLTNISLLQLSLSQNTRSSASRKFRHPCLRRIHFLIACLVSEIQDQFQHLRFVDDDTCHVLMQHFSWLQYFVRVCRRPVGSRTSKECISEIAIHWQWLNRKLIMSLCGIGFQFSQQLSEAMQQFQSSFGIDEAAMKMQATIRLLLGQPRPFQSRSVADAFTEAYLLSFQLESNNDDDKCDNVDGSLRTDIQKMKVRLVDSLISLDQNTVENCVRETKDLLNVLTTKCDMEDCKLLTRVALYPVCRLVAEMCEAQFVADVSNCIIPSDADVSCFIRYCSQHTAASPLTICSLKNMLSSSIEGTGEFRVSRSLTMRGIITQSGSSSSDVCSAMLCCNISRQILSVLSASNGLLNSYSAYSCLPADFTVGDGNSRCLQLKNLSQTLWTNAQLLCGANFHVYDNDCRLLKGTFRALISSLKSLLPVELFDTIDSCLAAADIDLYAGTHKRLSATARNSSELMMLVPDWPLQLSRCLQQIGNISISTGDCCRSAAMLGATWVEVGLLKMQLLTPRGPVDPSYRLAVKLEYASEDLRRIEHLLKAHNWQATLNTGQQLPTDSHPMIERQCRQQTKLKQWISEKSKLVAYRPELARYLALLHDVQQFMHGLGSSERIRELVTHLLQFFECGTATHGAIEEFKTLRAAVCAFVSRTEQDYILYCDIVVPFLKAVAETVHGLDVIVNAVRTAACQQKLYAALRCKHGMLNDFMRRLIQFPVSCENLKSGLWHTMCGMNFDALLKHDVCIENMVSPSQLQLRYISDVSCYDIKFFS